MAPIKEPPEPTLDPDVKQQQELLIKLLGGLPPGGERAMPYWGAADEFEDFLHAVVALSRESVDDAAQGKSEYSGPPAS